MKKYSYIFCLLLLFSAVCAAQTLTPKPVEDDSVFKISTALVRVDIAVKKGKIVTN